jgi:hypothetical protein
MVADQHLRERLDVGAPRLFGGKSSAFDLEQIAGRSPRCIFLPVGRRRGAGAAMLFMAPASAPAAALPATASLSVGEL